MPERYSARAHDGVRPGESARPSTRGDEARGNRDERPHGAPLTSDRGSSRRPGVLFDEDPAEDLARRGLRDGVDEPHRANRFIGARRSAA